MDTLSNGHLPCFTCGLVALPRREEGPQPGEWRKAVCSGCGHYLKWLPKPQEVGMAGSINRVVLVGLIGKYGVEVRFNTNGTACATFMLALGETGQDGKEYTTLVPCEIWGKKAESAGEVEAGAVVVFEGKLRRRSKGENQWEMVVSGFELIPIVSSPALTT